MNETRILADYVAKAKYEDLPDDVVDHAKKIISDTIACGLGGRKTWDVDVNVDIAKEMGGKPQATVFGEKTKFSIMQAVHLNALMAAMDDYSDWLLFCGHPANSLVPTALAIGEYTGASGKDIINATTLGYEVIARVSAAVRPSGMDTYAKTFNVQAGLVFGTPAVAGKLLGLNGEQIAAALGLAG